jgi:hypothetical protein
MEPKKDLQTEGWIPNPKDVKFDKIWNLLLAIAFMIPTVIGSLFLWTVLEI